MGEFLQACEHTDETNGRWVCDHATGHTKIGSDGLCNAVSLKLRDPEAASMVLSEELRKRVLAAIAL